MGYKANVNFTNGKVSLQKGEPYFGDKEDIPTLINQGLLIPDDSVPEVSSQKVSEPEEVGLGGDLGEELEEKPKAKKRKNK